MIVTCVMVSVKPGHVDDFKAATVENHRNSVKEPGNMRFDVLQLKSDPAKFILYEAYESEEAAVAHKDTDHYKTWRETVADWMAEPRQSIGCDVVAPGRTGW